MSSVRELNRLQSLDSELVARHEMLTEIQRQWEDTVALEELRQRVVIERQKLAELQRQQRTAEWQVEETRATLSKEEAKLYGGQIRNPKELTGLHDEVALLKQRLRQREDAVLEIMMVLEEQQALSMSLTQAVAQAESEREELEGRLLAQRKQIEAEVARFTTQREAIAAVVPTSEFRLYETLFTTKQGRAVARIERGICQGCRINLPMTVVQRVRTGQALVQCPSCGRVLSLD